MNLFRVDALVYSRAMLRSLLFNFAALASLVPAALIHLRHGGQGSDDSRPDGVFWAASEDALP